MEAIRNCRECHDNFEASTEDEGTSMFFYCGPCYDALFVSPLELEMRHMAQDEYDREHPED